MATVFLRINHVAEGETLTERFLINCTPRQENLIRRSNRRVASKDRIALFITLLCAAIPTEETLQARKSYMLEYLDELQELTASTDDEKAPLAKTILSGAKAASNTFFSSPYGLFKVTRSPVSILDKSSDFRVSSIIITNDLDIMLLNTLRP